MTIKKDQIQWIHIVERSISNVEKDMALQLKKTTKTNIVFVREHIRSIQAITKLMQLMVGCCFISIHLALHKR